MNKAQQIIEFLCQVKPRKIWEMDKNTLAKIRNIHDDNATYLWMPEPNYKDMPGTLLGIPIAIAKDKCFQLRYEFQNGESYIFKADIEI